jgi:hypothetical protein
MGSQSPRVPPPRAPRLGSIGRRITPAAVALIASATVSGPARASSPTVAVSGDAVLATNLPSFGQTTIEAIRPDAITGGPVVIGLFSGMANSGPFSVNTTTPTALNPAGDCWQKGALAQALTPDLQPGDTVTVTQAGSAGGGSSPISVSVQPPGANAIIGPISGCSDVAPWARNAVTSAPGSVTDGPVTVSGVAQPLATGVSVFATDGAHTTSPVTTGLGSDGSWTATIPSSQLAKLADTALTVRPVVAVPDVSSGALAHIRGVGVTLTKSASLPAAPPGHPGTGPSPTQTTPSPTGGSGSGRGRPRVSGLRVASTMTLGRARRTGIQVSFLVPGGARVARVALLHGNHRLFLATVRARPAGSRQRLRLYNAGLGRQLRPGVYTVAVQVGSSVSALGPLAAHAVRIR